MSHTEDSDTFSLASTVNSNEKPPQIIPEKDKKLKPKTSSSSSSSSSYNDPKELCLDDSVLYDDKEDEGYTDDMNRQISRVAGQEVPLYLDGLVNDAVSRQISRLSKKSKKNDDLEANSNDTNNNNDNDLSRTKSIPKNFNPNLNLSNHRKNAILFLSALSGFLSPMSNVAFLPAVGNIADTFHTTGTIINVSNAIYMVFMMLSPCVFSPLSDIYGRKPTFLTCLVGYVISSVLVGVSQNLAMFFVFRCSTAFFATAFFSVGAHVVGDIYPPVERGRKVSINVLGAQMGIVIGPIIGGIVVTWASWRIIFYILAGVGAFNFVGVLFIMPETIKETKMHQIIRETGTKKKFIFVGFNPLRILQSLVYPNLLLAGFICSAILYSMYNLLTPIRYVVDPRFGLTSPIYGALFYLPPGCGFATGAYFGGKFSDYTVKKWIKIRGKRIPEDRVRALLYSLFFVMPVTVFIYGWCLQYEKGGYAVPIIALYFYGVAQTLSFPAINAYCVDSMPELGGDAIGGNYFARYSLAIASSASCLPAIQTIGVGWCCTIGGFVTLSGGVAAVILIKYGEKWRKNALVKHGLRKEGEVYA